MSVQDFAIGDFQPITKPKHELRSVIARLVTHEIAYLCGGFKDFFVHPYLGKISNSNGLKPPTTYIQDENKKFDKIWPPLSGFV